MAVQPDIKITEAPPADKPPRVVPLAVSISIVGTFLMLLFAALYFARALVLPLILAVFVTLTFTPLVRALARRGVPPALTSILLVAALGGGVLGASIVLADPLSRFIEEAPQAIRELRDRLGASSVTVSALVETSKQVQEMTDGSTDGDEPQEVVIAQPGILSWAAGTLSGIGSTIGATLILAAFLLSSGDLFLQKLVRVLPTLRDKKRSLRIVHDVESEVSRYLRTITLINAAFGCVIGVAMAALGMPNPILWGLAAALLNYVPYLGALAGISLVAITAIVLYPTLTMAAFPPLAYLLINILEGTVITPLIVGKRLELNAVVILIALAFCGWLWGIVGALIAVPLLVIAKVFCDHLPNLANVGEFLSSQAPVAIETNGRAGRTDAPAS
jgi:predicted PurR-regulated permease PerM